MNGLRPSLNRLAGKTAIVTGAAQGIGASIAEVLAHEGAHVAIWDVQPDAGSSTAKRLSERGLRVSYVNVDLTDAIGVEEAVSATSVQHGGPHILVNNARRPFRGDLLSQSLDDWDQEIELLLKAVFHLSRCCIARMKVLGGGVILNVSSVAAFLTTPETPAYHAAKGGITELTRYLACEAGPSGVRVNAICPGHVLKTEQAGKPAAWQEFIRGIVPLRRVPTSIEI
ncbi:MAG: SDR family NAD(P)-dependent oxidoreductase, partial [bacterium]